MISFMCMAMVMFMVMVIVMLMSMCAEGLPENPRGASMEHRVFVRVRAGGIDSPRTPGEHQGRIAIRGGFKTGANDKLEIKHERRLLG